MYLIILMKSFGPFAQHYIILVINVSSSDYILYAKTAYRLKKTTTYINCVLHFTHFFSLIIEALSVV